MTGDKVADHVEAAVAAATPLASLDLTLADARGCRVAADVLTPAEWPSLPHCLYEGFAVRSADAGIGKTLSLLPDDDGAAAPVIAPGKTMAVRTGGALPAGADTVLPPQAVTVVADGILVTESIAIGAGCATAGSVAPADKLLLAAGDIVDDRAIGVLAANGLSRLAVRPHPRVVIVTIGHGLISVGSAATNRSRFDPVGPLLSAATTAQGAVPYRVGPIDLDHAAVMDCLEDQLVRADLIVTVGGATGLTDVVPTVLAELGDVTYTENGPQFGRGEIGLESTPILVLPADPVQAYSLFRLLADPLIQQMRDYPEPARQEVQLANSVLSRDSEQIVLGVAGDQGVTALTGSANLLDLLAADFILTIPSGQGEIEAGSVVAAVPLGSR